MPLQEKTMRRLIWCVLLSFSLILFSAAKGSAYEPGEQWPVAGYVCNGERSTLGMIEAIKTSREVYKKYVNEEKDCFFMNLPTMNLILLSHYKNFMDFEGDPVEAWEIESDNKKVRVFYFLNGTMPPTKQISA